MGSTPISCNAHNGYAIDANAVRSNLPGNRTARVIFCIVQGRMVLLDGFVKKTQKTPDEDLALARRRMKEIDQ